MTVISVPQALKAGKTAKAIIKASLKLKENIKKSDSVSMLSDSLSETVIKCIHQNQAPAKDNFAEWLRVPDCKLHKLMLWNFEKNAKE